MEQGISLFKVDCKADAEYNAFYGSFFPPIVTLDSCLIIAKKAYEG